MFGGSKLLVHYCIIFIMNPICVGNTFYNPFNCIWFCLYGISVIIFSSTYPNPFHFFSSHNSRSRAHARRRRRRRRRTRTQSHARAFACRPAAGRNGRASLWSRTCRPSSRCGGGGGRIAADDDDHGGERLASADRSGRRRVRTDEDATAGGGRSLVGVVACGVCDPDRYTFCLCIISVKMMCFMLSYI